MVTSQDEWKKIDSSLKNSFAKVKEDIQALRDSSVKKEELAEILQVLMEKFKENSGKLNEKQMESLASAFEKKLEEIDSKINELEKIKTNAAKDNQKLKEKIEKISENKIDDLKYLKNELEDSLNQKISKINNSIENLKTDLERTIQNKLSEEKESRIEFEKKQDSKLKELSNSIDKINQEHSKTSILIQELNENLKKKISLEEKKSLQKKVEEISEHKISEEEIKFSSKFIKLVIFLIPFLIISYLIYSHFLSEQKFNYFYDIGSEIDSKNPYLMPQSRISPIYIENNIYLRNITDSLVYFSIPYIVGSDIINISIKLKDVFVNDSFVKIGAKNKPEWSYLFVHTYNPMLQQLGTPEVNNSLALYKISNYSISLADFLQSPPKSSVIATDQNLFLKQVKIQNYSPTEFEINTYLRGTHTFYVYAKDSLYLEITKQDLNWYNNSDTLLVSVYNLTNDLIKNITIEDDGIILDTRNKTDEQVGILNLNNITESVYKIIIESNSDLIVKKIKINQNKLVVANQVFLANSDIYLPNSTKTTELYFQPLKNCTIQFSTYHEKAFQTVRINDEPIEIQVRNEKFSYFVQPSDSIHKVVSEKNNIIVFAPLYFSFTKDSYFEPFEYRVVPLKNDIEWIMNNTDFVFTRYSTSYKQDGWIIINAQFDIKDLYIQDGKLNMLIQIIYPSKTDIKNYSIPIDWLNISVIKYSKIKW